MEELVRESLARRCLKVDLALLVRNPSVAQVHVQAKTSFEDLT
jgi:hypothetical protein